MEKGRHDNIPKKERVCIFCDDNVGPLEDGIYRVTIFIELA